jgi:tRNA-specific 2-thiouridylase
MTTTMMTTRTRTEASPSAAPSRADVDAELAGLKGHRVAVALSGGVDSAVAALRLVQAGAEVVGVALRLHDPQPGNPLAPRACCAPDDLADARHVCDALGVPFYVIDAREAFEAGVVAPFVRAYLDGRTPNPCVGCNGHVKLGVLDRRARALGAVALATGHYARRRIDAEGRVHLHEGLDRDKDQSYFLFGTEPEVLARLIFPLGTWTKDEVRRVALESGLPVAHKLDSQEVCFVGGAGAGGFVASRPEAVGDRAGPIVDLEGNTLGRHDGVAGFTVGQRRGLGVGGGGRLYVLQIDAEARTVTVGPDEALARTGLRARDARWPAGVPTAPLAVRARVRYRDPGAPAIAEPSGDGGLRLRFDRPVRAIAPGQAVVLYVGDELVGGAWIEEATA